MVSPKRVNQPVITIEAMVRVGPWTIERVRDGEWRNCDRCDADHKQVWVCSIDTDDANVVAHLWGKRTWNIGSTCGPKLMLMTNSFWGENLPPGFWEQETKDLTRKVKLVVDAGRAIEEAKKDGGDFLYLDIVTKWFAVLKQDKLTRHYQKVLRHHTNGILNALKYRRAEAAKKASLSQ